MSSFSLRSLSKHRSNDSPHRGRHALRRGKHFFIPAIQHLEDRTLLSTVDYWTGASAHNGGNDNWSNSGNWSLGAVPGTTDTADFTSSESEYGSAVMDTATTVSAVVIDSTWGGTLTVSNPLTVAGDFTMASGTLNGNGTISASGSASEWSGGSINFGTGSLANSGTMTIATNNGGLNFGGTLTNTGTIDVTGANTIYSQGDGAAIDNQAGATFDFQADANLSNGNGTTGVFTNAGTLTMSASSGTTDISFAVGDTGTIDGVSSAIDLTGGGSGGTSSSPGTVTAGTGAAVTLSGSYSGAFKGSGAGSVVLSDFTGTGMGGATLDFTGSVLEWAYGQNGRTLGGTVTNSGDLTIATQASYLELAGTLTNTGTGSIVVTGTSTIYSDLADAAIDNQAGGTFDIQGAASISDGNGTTGVFTNAGTLERSTGSGTATIDFPVNDTGTIAGDSGTLELAGGGSGGTIGSPGLVNAGTGGTVVLGGSFSGALAGSGAGAVVLSGFDGTGPSGAALDFTGSVLDWAYGQNGHSLSGTVTNSGDLTIATQANYLELAGTLTNTGTGSIIVTGAGTVYSDLADATIDNQAGAIFAFQAGANISNGNGTTGVFTSAGTLEMPTGGASPTISFQVVGTIELGSGTLDLNGGASDLTVDAGSGATAILNGGSFIGGIVFDVAQGGTVDLTDGNTVTYSGTLTGSGGGTVQLSGGIFYPELGGVTLNFAGSLFQWTGGAMELSVGDVTNLGTINLSGSNNEQIYADGTLDNLGTIIQTGTGDFELHSDNISPTTLKNESGATYLIESDAGINNAGGGDNVIDNLGTIRKTAGTGTSNWYIPTQGYISNTGTIEADSGTLTLDASSITQISGGTLTGGTWNAADGATLQFPSGTAITSNEGTLSLNGAGATITGIAGLASSSGSFAVTSGADFHRRRRLHE